jgi:hypothetical protein
MEGTPIFDRVTAMPINTNDFQNGTGARLPGNRQNIVWGRF